MENTKKTNQMEENVKRVNEVIDKLYKNAKKINEIRKELFKDFEEDFENYDEKPVYYLEMYGDFEDIVADFSDFNIDFHKELYKILPNNVISLGYMCSCCGTWMSACPSSLCTMCEENYYSDLRDLEKDNEDDKAKEWVEYYSSRDGEKLVLLFRTDSEVDLDFIKNNFKPLRYIKEIDISRASKYAELDGQYAVIAYDNMYISE